uniref:SLH domain-containing protein n=1 Tax=Aegilops tauschii subsp. strangulata TaxID=200361 RepID=A0A453MMX5_AEGTS
AQPSPEPEAGDSFAGWSDKEQDKDDSADSGGGPFGGLVGPALAGLLFLAGITFAAISIRGSKAPLPTHTETTADTTPDQQQDDDNDAAAAQALSPADDATSEATDTTPLPNNLQTDETIHEGAADHDDMDNHQLDLDRSSSHLDPTTDKYVASQDATQTPPVSHSPQSLVPAYDPPSENATPDPQEALLLDSEPNLPEYQDTTFTSDIMVLESGDVVQISDAAIEAAASHTYVQDTEQSPDKLSTEDGLSASTFPDYVAYGSTDQMLPSGSNDLPTQDANPAKAIQDPASDQDQAQNAKPFSSGIGIPAPSMLSAALQVPAGQIVVPAVVDPTQGNALAALQVLKVIEPDARAGDLCTRREYARWLVVASNSLSRNTYSKVYPAMYIENVSELAFDDVTTEDPDFPFIQGLAEAGLISSKLSRSDMDVAENVENNHYFFSADSPLSRQDLVSWKMALDKRQLPEVDKNSLYKTSGYIDIDKIDTAAWPALVADLGAGDQSITALAFGSLYFYLFLLTFGSWTVAKTHLLTGFTRLFQPDKPVTKGQAALALSTGDYAEVVMEELARIEAEKIAEAAVNAHGALIAEVEKQINASFERELTREKEKIETLEKLAEEARAELDKLRAEREEEKNALLRGRATVESEIQVLSKLRCEVEEQLQNVLSKKVEINFEKNRIEKLQKEIESENQAAVQLQYELEVERKALSMARAWAEDEAKKAREHARALEEARNQWERQGIKVVVEAGLEEDASAGVTWANAGKEHPVDEAINRAESLLEKLKSFGGEMKVRSSHALERVMQYVRSLISSLKERAAEARQGCADLGAAAASKAKNVSSEAKAFGSSIRDRSKKVVEECKDGLEKFVHRFKTD